MNAPASDDSLLQDVETFRRNNMNVSAAARELGIPRPTMQHRLREARARGMLDGIEANDPNSPSREEYLGAKARKIAAFQAKKRKGDWRKPVRTTLPYEPFILVLLGDPHIDNDGCNFELFEKSWMSMGVGTYGLCVGDFFDNWTRSLAHLYREQTVAPSDAWLLFDHLMSERGEYLLAGCSGNHDDWAHGPVDPIQDMMRRHGVIYRDGAIRLQVAFSGTDRVIHISMRHKWRGNSMYSAAHALKRGAREGWSDNILIGGHIHQDEHRMHVGPDGVVSHLCQLSAFKEFDNYADVQGYMPHKISPAWYAVVDPRKPDTDPDMVKVFWNLSDARSLVEAIR